MLILTLFYLFVGLTTAFDASSKIEDVHRETPELKGCSPTLSLPPMVLPELKSRLVDMVKIRNRACQTVETSKRNADRANLLFRFFGMITILLSVLLPFISTLETSWKSRVMSAMAVLIALATGLNAFFDFQNTWAKSRVAQYKLRYEIVDWEQSISKALRHQNSNEAITEAEDATRILTKAWKEGVLDRAHQYFEDVESAQTKALSSSP